MSRYLRWPTFSRSTPETRQADDWTLYSTDAELELLLSITAQEPKGREALTPEREPSSWALPILRRLIIQARWRRRMAQREARATVTVTAAAATPSLTTADDVATFRAWLADAWPTATASLRSSLSALAGKLGVDLPKARPPLMRMMRRLRSARSDAGGGARSPATAPRMQARSENENVRESRESKPAEIEPRASDWTSVGGSRDSLRDRLHAATRDDDHGWH